MKISALAEAIRHAVTTFTDADSEEETFDGVTESIASELQVGVIKLPGIPLQQDLPTYILALVATKALAGCRGDGHADEYREGALRCLESAAAELRHRVRTDVSLVR